MRAWKKWLVVPAVLVVAVILFNLLTFRVYVTEHAVVTRFGNV